MTEGGPYLTNYQAKTIVRFWITRHFKGRGRRFCRLLKRRRVSRPMDIVSDEQIREKESCGTSDSSRQMFTAYCD
jgi:hypothetical protein